MANLGVRLMCSASIALAGLALAGCDSGQADDEGARSNPPAGSSFSCTPTRVLDGDGPIDCTEGPTVRLAGIAARELDGSCWQGQPCPTVGAEASRDHLARLLSGKPSRLEALPSGDVAVKGPRLSCLSDRSAGGSRTAAWCVSPAVGDLSCAMVRDGYALKCDRYWRGHRC